jgi:hypothetical protein
MATARNNKPHVARVSDGAAHASRRIAAALSM